MTFADFARSHGLIPPALIEPGKTHRVPTTTHERKRNGLLRLDEDGKGGIAINYESGDEPQQWKANGEKVEYDPAKDNAARNERIAKKRAEEKRGTERAKAEYDRATALVGAKNEYLERKMIQMDACRSLRVDSAGNLLIPMHRRGKFISLQRISPSGEKKFATGAPSRGAMLEIRRPTYSMTILAEGFATAACIFSACQTARVIVCFSAENLVRVAEENEWSGFVTIAADNDVSTEENTGKNPGVECANRAAKIIGCGVAIPHPENGTDWQDVFAEQYARLEKAEESKSWKTSPHKLRASALSFISPSIMRNAVFIE